MLIAILLPLLAHGLYAGELVLVDGEREAPRRRLEELFLGELIHPQEEGEMQVTTGLWLERDGKSRTTVVPLMIEYGVTDRLQFELELPYEHRDDEQNDDGEKDASGIGNISIGALWQLVPDGEPRLATGVELTFPSSSSGVGDDAWTLEPFLLAYRAGDQFDLDAGAGFALIHDAEGFGLGGHGALACITDLGPCVGTLEILGELDDPRFALSAAVGTVWRFSGFELGCAFAAGLNDAAPDQQILITLTREWQLALPITPDISRGRSR